MDGRNIVIIQGFKEYCALGFFQGALLKDPKKLLVQQLRVTRAIRTVPPEAAHTPRACGK